MSSRAVQDFPPIRLLCVEDNPDDVELMGIALERADPVRRYELHRRGQRRQLRRRAHGPLGRDPLRFQPSPLLALRGAQILVTRRCSIPLIVLTRAIGEEAVHVLRCGAKDY